MHLLTQSFQSPENNKQLHDITIIFWDSELNLLSDLSPYDVDITALKSHVRAVRFQGDLGECTLIYSNSILSSPITLLCVGIGKLNNESPVCIARAMHIAVKYCQKRDLTAYYCLYPKEHTSFDTAQWVENVAYGCSMALYQYTDCRNKTKPAQVMSACTLCHGVASNSKLELVIRQVTAIVDGQFLAKDLMHTPPNILYPMAFADRMRSLEEHGIRVEVLNEADLAAENMGSLLAVGQGSSRESALAFLHWPGDDAHKDAQPLALVGKGICYDSGGINLKTSMQVDMKYDMGGAACVAGSLLSLAKNKCPYPVVGVLALAENMPDGNATRPSDVLTSRSGRTISVLNTDAEGRLVLADAIDYTIDRYNPACVIDTATLTGAMIVSLGHEYAGLFCNDDTLSERLLTASKDCGEKLWRMPLDEAFDKMIDSPIADVANLGTPSGVAGSITAAQFLARFAKNVPWAHIDIAGTAWLPGPSSFHDKGPTAYGVWLLSTFCSQYSK